MGSEARTLLVLWDVDGTLIHNGGVSKMAYAVAFETLVGRPTTEPVITQGRTDPAIMRSLLVRNGVEPDAALLARLPEALRAAVADLVPVLRKRGHAMPGAAAAIAALARQVGVVQSVLTGNIGQNAYVKLAAFGLEKGLDFGVGAYGSDHEVRAELVGAALGKLRAKHGLAVPVGDVVLIGDTPRDVEAGKTSGARVIGVASGEFDEQRLAAEGADLVLPDLTNTRRVVNAVVSLRGGTFS